MAKSLIPRVIFWIFVGLVVLVFLALVIPFVMWIGVLWYASVEAGAKRTPGQLAVDEAVAFHEDYYNDSSEGAAYDIATPEFRAEMSRADFLRLMETMHSQLGNWKWSQLDHPPTSTVDGVTPVTVEGTSGFEKGEAKETIQYVVSANRKARLRSFHIELPGQGTGPAASP